MARMLISSGSGTSIAPSSMHRALRLLHHRPSPTLQQPHHRPHTCWGLLPSHPAVQLQTRLFCSYMDYCNNNGGEEHTTTTTLLDAAMVPIREDLHRLDDGARSRLVEASLLVISQLLRTAPQEAVGATLRREISGNKEEVKRAMEKIRGSCGPNDKKRKLAEGILEQLGTIH